MKRDWEPLIVATLMLSLIALFFVMIAVDRTKCNQQKTTIGHAVVISTTCQ